MTSLKKRTELEEELNLLPREAVSGNMPENNSKLKKDSYNSGGAPNPGPENIPDGDTQNTNEVTVGKRLQEARLRAGFKTASIAAREFGVPGPTYLAHENGTRTIRSHLADFYARKLNVTVEWLLFDKGSIDEKNDAAARRFDAVVGDPIVEIYMPLLARLNLKWDNGKYVKASGMEKITLPRLDRNIRFLPVLDIVDKGGKEPVVEIPGAEFGNGELGIIDVVAISLNTSNPGRYFAVKPRPDDPQTPDGSTTRLLVLDYDGANRLTPGSYTLGITLQSDQLRILNLHMNYDEQLEYSWNGADGSWKKIEKEKPIILGTIIYHIADTSNSVSKKLHEVQLATIRVGQKARSG